MPPPSDIVKVAIEWPGANAQLLEIDQVSSQNEKQWCKERGLGSVWQRVSSGLGTTDISKGKLRPAPSCGRLVTKAWERLPLPQKVSRKKSTRRPQVHLAWPPSRQSLGTNRMWSKGHSLSFRNGPWHPSSRKFVMGKLKLLVLGSGKPKSTVAQPDLERSPASQVPRMGLLCIVVL